jgi:hypothetical protein
MNRRVGGYAAVGFGLGVVLGAFIWSSQIRRSRRDLFSPSPVKRLAALAYLKGNTVAVSSAMLRDYIHWEPKPALRRRGEKLLRRVQHQAAD